MAAVEYLTEVLLPEEEVVESELYAGHGREAPLRCVGHHRERVDCGHLGRKVGATDTGQVGGDHEQVRRVGEWGEGPGEYQREAVATGRIGPLGELEHLVLEPEQTPGIDLEREMEVEWSTACLIGVEVDLPGLAERIRLHEVPLVVNVEAVIGRMVLQVGNESGDIDDGQSSTPSLSLDDSVRRRGAIPLVWPRLGGSWAMTGCTDDELIDLLHRVCAAVADSLAGLDDWGLAGTQPGQHRSDLVADEAALGVLSGAPVGVLSEESGLRDGDADLVVIVDPLDGSTNAAHGIPWYATSLCAVDREGPRAALVVNQASGESYRAVRGGGAFCGDVQLNPSTSTDLGDSLIALSGYPPRYLGWRQFRALGAAALDLCLVAAGVVDGYLDCSRDAHGSWDYLAGALICGEAGASVGDAFGRDLLILEHGGRRTPVAAATVELQTQLIEQRRMLGAPGEA